MRCGEQAGGRRRRGCCQPCYRALRRSGPQELERFPPMRASRELPKDMRSRLLSQAIISADGCWLWSGNINRQTGYGHIRTLGGVRERQSMLAHRAMYELWVGPIPEGLHLDHLCRVRRCVNPAHLEPVTARVNTFRSPFTLASKNAAKTHCPRGHEFTPENTLWHRPSRAPGKQYRVCRTCDKARKRARRQAKAS